jgi:putative transposase
MAALGIALRKAGGRAREVDCARLEMVAVGHTNQRADFVHRLSTKLIKTHQAVCIEDLNVRGLASLAVRSVKGASGRGG